MTNQSVNTDYQTVTLFKKYVAIDFNLKGKSHLNEENESQL